MRWVSGAFQAYRFIHDVLHTVLVRENGSNCMPLKALVAAWIFYLRRFNLTETSTVNNRSAILLTGPAKLCHCVCQTMTRGKICLYSLLNMEYPAARTDRDSHMSWYSLHTACLMVGEGNSCMSSLLYLRTQPGKKRPFVSAYWVTMEIIHFTSSWTRLMGATQPVWPWVQSTMQVAGLKSPISCRKRKVVLQTRFSLVVEECACLESVFGYIAVENEVHGLWITASECHHDCLALLRCSVAPGCTVVLMTELGEAWSAFLQAALTPVGTELLNLSLLHCM